MQIVEESNARGPVARAAVAPADGAGAEIWLAATVAIAAMTVFGLGLLSYVY